MEKVLVLGKGKSGLGATVLLQKFGIDYAIYNTDEFCKLYDEKSDLDFLYCVLSPGVPLDCDAGLLLAKNNIPIISEVELASQFCDKNAKIVSVTGTDGKTTTTLLAEHILKTKNAVAVGNVGVCFAETVANQKNDIYICETSSFQADMTLNFHPKVAVLLNLSPDHFDRHKTYENYINAKLKIFKNQNKTDFAILNADDALVCERAANIPANKFYFSTKKEVRGCFVRGNRIYFKDKSLDEVCSVLGYKLEGSHNLENLLASVLIAILCGATYSEIAKQIVTFMPLKHRFSYVGEYDGVKFFNASKATNVHSAIACLNMLDRPAVVIMGGSSKNEDFVPIFESLPDFVKLIVIVGDNETYLKDLCMQYAVPHLVYRNFKTAVKKAFLNCAKGYEVALIPASASFDRFSSYKQRGEVFEEIFLEIKNEKMESNKK